MISTVLLFTWMGLIFYASSQTDAATVPWLVRFGIVPPGLDASWLHLIEFVTRKSVHLFTYAVLAILAYRTESHWRTGLALRKRFWAAWAFAVLYAASDELHQRFVPGRSGEVRDVLIDAAGAAAGLGLAWLWHRRNHHTIQGKE